MSYLSVPRIHFSGRFQADPSTINNNDANFDPTVQYKNVPANPNDPNNTSVYWNPIGTHNWKMIDCSVKGAANDKGQFQAPSGDPIIGAKVESTGGYPAKLVDLDPDNQSVSQIWGLEVTINIPDPKDSSKSLASVTGTLPATAFRDLWNRTTNAPNPDMPTMSAAFQEVLQDVTWVNPEASPLLKALNAVSPTSLSIRFNVDSFQPGSTQANFTFGRIVGTIGPALPGEAPGSSPRRLSPVYFAGGAPSIISTYGPVNAAWSAARKMLTLDLGNCIPTIWSPPPSPGSVPAQGWPLLSCKLELQLLGQTVGTRSYQSLKSGAGPVESSLPPIVPFSVQFDTHYYTTFAGIVDIPIPDSQVANFQSKPLTLLNVTAGQVAAQEDPQGHYVDVSIPFYRLNPGEAAEATVWATTFGKAWSNATIPVSLLPVVPASNGGPWNNGDPQSAVAISNASPLTDASGKATFTITASDPGTPRVYPNGHPGPDGQVFQISGTPNVTNGDWPSWGQIFLFAGAPLNLLVFSSAAIPTTPTWDHDVGPILSLYAKMYPYMKTIIDIGDYDTVIDKGNNGANLQAIDYVLNLSPTDPHYMPVVRDLSRDKLAIINKWIANGAPRN